jgi:hypothetical protein
MELQFSELRLDNPGIIKTTIPASVFSELSIDLQKQIDEKQIKHNNYLAGHLETELVYKVNGNFKKCLEQTFLEYRKMFNYYPYNKYEIDAASWANFQKKHEYNPIHFHTEDISWVIWLTIPYDLEEELNAPNVRESNYKTSSMFQFIYNKLDGRIDTKLLPIDKTWQGTLIMFPSYLRHQVYPFQTSDEHRISMSGNIRVIHD